MKLIHQNGDIFTTTATAIGHGVNTRGIMGSGIAVQFRTRYPDMFEAYRHLCLTGDFHPGEVFDWQEDRLILNIASQEFPGANATMEYLVAGVREALAFAAKRGHSVLALPRIGSGIGGLDIDEVEQALTGLAEASPVDIELWTYPA